MTGEYQESDPILVALTIRNEEGNERAVHEVIVAWNEEERAVSAYVGEGDILIGMALLRGCIGSFDFFPGCISTIEPRE